MAENIYFGFDNRYDNPIRVCLFVSRNKDNKEIKNFVERRKAFITTKRIEDLEKDFSSFVSDGVDGEMCRMYISVNARNKKKIYQQLLHFLIDNPDFDLSHINSKIASIAAKKECALEKRWLFDFDCDDRNKLKEFSLDLSTACPMAFKLIYKTSNGYAIVINQGFDTRELLEKYKDIVTLKRDDLLCVGWRYTCLED